jgi:hypothetical protein
MSFDEPERVTIEAFGHTFRDLLVGIAEDLRMLEREGAIYANFVDPSSGDEDVTTFTRYRIQLTPAEIFEYVEAHLAQQEFYEALNRADDFAAAVLAISDENIESVLLSTEIMVRSGRPWAIPMTIADA